MPNEFEKKELRPLPGGDFETDCLVCGETVMHQQGDLMEMYVGKNPDGTSEVFGVFCAMCAKGREDKKTQMPTTDIFSSGSNDLTKKLLEKARKHNDNFDAIDREHDYPTPSECEFDSFLRTAISAICAGLDLLAANDLDGGKDCIAEGLCMVQDAELMARKRIRGAV